VSESCNKSGGVRRWRRVQACAVDAATIMRALADFGGVARQPRETLSQTIFYEIA
jgi:hypothetical protein